MEEDLEGRSGGGDRLCGSRGRPTQWLVIAQATGRGELTRYALDDGLVEAGDDWHESTRAGEASYNLALPGAVRVYAPQIIAAGVASPLRVAWMPNAKALLRADATILALEPADESGERFAPPRLVAFRADALDDNGPKAGDPVYVDPE